jgi:hypothetical protein
MKVWMCLNNGDPLAVSYDIALEHLGKSPKNYVIIKDDRISSIVRHTGGFGVDGEGMLTFDRAIREAHTRVVATHA